MPTYRITHPETGKVIRMTGDSPPSEQDIHDAFASVGVENKPPTPATPPASADAPPEGGGVLQTVKDMVRPTLEYGGAALGGVIGAAGGTALEPIGGTIAGGVAGSALGFAGGKRVADAVLGEQKPVMQDLKELPGDIATGAAMEAVGQVAGKALSATVGGIGKFGRVLLGRMTGTGEAAMAEAVKSGKIGEGVLKSATDYDRALRGHISGEEIVDNAKFALDTLKDARQQEYQVALGKLEQANTPIDMVPIKTKAQNILKRFVRVDPTTGVPDWSRSALGPEGSEGVKKAKEIIETVNSWGSKPEDATPVGLDMLKRQLDDFYSESSNARSLVTSIRNVVKSETVKAVPEYSQMTKGYEEATKVIKDVEAGLMLRKQGMSGRTVADQTLRRLQSAMKDNFKLRNELLGVISNTEAGDLQGQIAGNVSSSLLPHGLSGTGPAIVGEAALAHFVNPAFWPLVAASSPRVAGEFLRLVGKAAAKTQGATIPVGKTLAYLALSKEQATNEDNQ